MRIILLLLLCSAPALAWRWSRDANLCRYGRPECIVCDPTDAGYVPMERQCVSWEERYTAEAARCLNPGPVRAGDAACKYTLPTDWTVVANKVP